MKIFSVACFLLLALVPAFAADRPIFSESFEAAGHVAYHGANGPMEGLGRWAVNQVTGMSVMTLDFEGVENDLTILRRFDMDTEYIMQGEQCSAQLIDGPMPVTWSWLKEAKHTGNNLVNGELCDLWEAIEGDESYLLAVNAELTPVLFERVNLRSQERLVLQLESIEFVTADVTGFTVPAPCTTATFNSVRKTFVNETLEADEPILRGNMGAVIAKAKEIGTCGCPYVYGGNGGCCQKGKKGGYDCSGLVQRAYSAGGYSLPRVARDQQKKGKACSGGLKAGDLIFWGKPAYHVTMYIGNNKLAECPRTGLNCRITPLRSYDGGCRRIV